MDSLEAKDKSTEKHAFNQLPEDISIDTVKNLCNLEGLSVKVQVKSTKRILNVVYILQNRREYVRGNQAWAI